MNSFETDLKRAFLGKGFWLGLLAQTAILLLSGAESDLYRISFPALCALPYGTPWLQDYQSGFLKAYVLRCGRKSYIFGKIVACGVSGGALEALACWIYAFAKKQDFYSLHPELLFGSGMLWAVLAAVLAAATSSRCIAFGGSFVIYYLLVILQERYLPNWYCLHPYEWLNPQHTWIFGSYGVLWMVAGLTAVLICIYYEILRRCIEGV